MQILNNNSHGLCDREFVALRKDDSLEYFLLGERPCDRQEIH